MSKDRRDIQTTTITIEVPVLIKSYLEDLVRTGLYGLTVEQAAHWIIADEIRRQVIELKTLNRRTW